MQDKYAIEVKNITKKFRVFYDKSHQLKDSLLFWKRNSYEERWVLKDISLQVKKGEAIGLIGHNGCGKSTTLKLLTKIMYPDSGTITMSGRVSSLIELGAGFHPDMSGRENIYTNASIFGLTRKEINERLERIIAFSELEEFIDNPVRTYSSGMYMRLAFSVAINVDADILLIDEILAVGDSAFQAKCFRKLHEIKANGATIVIVSHSLEQIEQICDRSIWLHDGKIRLEGLPMEVHPKYMEYMNGKQNLDVQTEAVLEKVNSEAVKFQQIFLRNGQGMEKTDFESGEKVELQIVYEASVMEGNQVVVDLKVYRADGVLAYGTDSRNEPVFYHPWKQRGSIYCEFECLNLVEGQYWIDIVLREEDGCEYISQKKACTFSIHSMKDEEGIASLTHSWRLGRE